MIPVSKQSVNSFFYGAAVAHLSHKHVEAYVQTLLCLVERAYGGSGKLCNGAVLHQCRLDGQLHSCVCDCTHMCDPFTSQLA